MGRDHCDHGLELCACDPPCRGRCPVCGRRTHARLDKTHKKRKAARGGRRDG